MVLLMNDNYTTMDFVEEILKLVFHKSPEEANRIMLTTHGNGHWAVGVYTLDIANTKAQQVHQAGKECGFPLRCIVEKA